MGQFYEPLSIGTAKPDWKNAPVPHHLFDSITEPRSYTTTQYQADFIATVAAIRARGNVPLIVGGSFFYCKSLFFTSPKSIDKPVVSQATVPSWQALHDIDPKRAAAIHPHDTYRISRALEIYHTTGTMPSAYEPVYRPLIDNFFVLSLTRERDDLYARINERTKAMFAAGWIDEVARLDPVWHQFLTDKKIIGYPEIISYLYHNSPELARLITDVQQATRRYAKRQLTFWRMFERQLSLHAPGTNSTYNLTLSPVDLYLRRLCDRIIGLVKKDTE